ncbi:hypothetical protein G7046_g3547 [Stylonectria norvegica]|nr:hypothetical protein G7046_g3547 [Stylonectria norvegica]
MSLLKQSTIRNGLESRHVPPPECRDPSDASPRVVAPLGNFTSIAAGGVGASGFGSDPGAGPPRSEPMRQAPRHHAHPSTWAEKNMAREMSMRETKQEQHTQINARRQPTGADGKSGMNK